MSTHIPTLDDLRVVLTQLSYPDLRKLSRVSGVPYTTLWKVRSGETPNPRLNTVRAFWPHALRFVEEEPAKEAA